MGRRGEAAASPHPGAAAAHVGAFPRQARSLGGALLIGASLAAIAIAYVTTCLGRSLLSWAAFILAHPFGAIFGDLLTKPIKKGGLALGTAAPRR